MGEKTRHFGKRYIITLPAFLIKANEGLRDIEDSACFSKHSVLETVSNLEISVHERVTIPWRRLMSYPLCLAKHREKKGICHETWNET